MYFNGKKRFKGLPILLISICLLFAGFQDATAYTADTCLNNTRDEAACKDCCDCLDDPAQRQACRDTCVVTDFSDNSDYITVDAPSTLGPDGDYSAATGTGSESECKTYCDESGDLDCGDRRFCRDACNETFSGGTDSPEEPPDPGNDKPSGSGDINISIDQALSDEAQMKTLAFSGLAFLTGDLCANTFFPPGKVSDFFGFQYLRDITPNGFGHNTEFAGRISDSVLSILSDTQVQDLVDLANTQGELVDTYGYKRFVLIEAFLRLLENDLPDGATGLDMDAVKTFTSDLYEIDAGISYGRAQVLGGIVADMTDDQKREMAELLDAFNTLFEETGMGGTIDSNEWPATTPVDLSGLTVNDGRVLVSTFATQLFSWHLGSVEGDTYFCPERHGTYFGSFYMKDIPPLTAREAVSIDMNLTAEMGEAFIEALDDTQASLVTGLVDLQRDALISIVAKREEIAEKLRPFMDGIFVSEDEVKSLVRQYGEFEGEMIYHYATNFSAVGNTLTPSQTETVMGLRLGYYERFPDYQEDPTVYDCSGAWLYASRIDMPVIENTDFLFGVDSGSSVSSGALTLVSDGFAFSEGPAADTSGNLYFSDILANRIYERSPGGVLTVFTEDLQGPNGIFFDLDGSLLVCEGGSNCLVDIDAPGDVTVVANVYDDALFNEPNDLWVSPDGGIYFTDPVYFGSRVQDGEHVYYLPPDRGSVVRVIDDMVRPNGIVGTAAGDLLYVTDHGAGQTFRYAVESDGTLSDRQVFASVGADGMTIDTDGNLYLCENEILVYDAAGNHIESISVPEQPTNACFGGTDGKTLFVTTRSAVYSMQMNTSGVIHPGSSDDTDTADTSSDDASSSDDTDAADTSFNDGSGSSGCFIKSLFGN